MSDAAKFGDTRKCFELEKREVSVRSRNDLVLTEKHPLVEGLLRGNVIRRSQAMDFSVSTLQIALIWKDKEGKRYRDA